MFLWMDEKRAQYQEKYPEMSNTEISRHMAQAWNKLSEEKKVNVFLGTSLQLTGFLLLLENLEKTRSSSPGNIMEFSNILGKM